MDVLTEEGLEHFASLVKKDINTKANTDSPILTGTPEAPTPGSSATSTQIATVGYIDKSIDTVNTAIENAQSTADSAVSAAKNAQTAADNAQSTANDAVNTAENASDKSETAVETANEALYIAQTAADGDYAPINHASGSTKYGTATESLYGHVRLIDHGTDSYGVDSGVAVAPSALADIDANAEEAKTNAAQALQNSDTALSISNANSEYISEMSDDIDNLSQYSSVGEVDLNDYYYMFSKIYVSSSSSNAPSNTESFFVDVHIDSTTDIVRQFATGDTTGNIYIRMGTLIPKNDVVLDKTSGTIVVNGNLGGNLYVNGNVRVSGTISGIVYASGTISYGSLTGTARANMNITAGDCNIQVDGGNLTFNSTLTYEGDTYYEDVYGSLYTEGSVTNASGTVTNMYRCTINIKTNSDYGFYNAGSITVDKDGAITATNENESGYGIYNNDGATFTVNGGVYGYAPLDISAVYGTFTGDGAVYANDEEYYAGNGGTPDPSGFAVTWKNWINVSANGGLTGTAGSGINFIWLDNGTLKATTETVGSENTPVYLNSGEIQPTDHSFDEYMPISGGTFTGGIFGNVVDVDNGEIDLSKGNMFNLNLIDDIELSFVNTPENVATSFSLIVTGEGEVTWTDNIIWNGKNEPTFKEDYTTVITFLTINGGENWFGYISIKDEEVESELSGTVGSETQPIYLDDGELKETSTALSDYMPLSGGVFTGGYFGKTVVVEGNEIDISEGSVFSLDLVDDIELSFIGVPENAAACFSLIISGEANVTWLNNIEWNGKIEPTFKDDSSVILTFLTPNGGEIWYGSVSIQNETSDNNNGTGLTGTVGSETQPIYLDDGELKETSTSLEDYMPLSGGTITGDVKIANGVNVDSEEDSEGIVINGLIITSEGHIKLPSGIEFY